MFQFLATDIREQKKYEMRTEISVDNTVNDLRYEIKFENCVKDKITFFEAKHCFSFLNKKIFYSWRHIFLKISKNLIASAFFLSSQILKKIDMPLQKPQMLRW